MGTSIRSSALIEEAASLAADGEIIYRAKDLKVGLFQQDAPLQPGT